MRTPRSSISAFLFAALLFAWPGGAFADTEDGWKIVEASRSVRLEPGVRFEAYRIKPPELPVYEVWIYRPDPAAAEPVPLVIVPPAGGSLVAAPQLTVGDRPEHLPYVRAGFAVVSFSMHGQLGDDPSDEEFMRAAQDFRAGRAGLDNARSALSVALARIPNVDTERVFAAGHSSAGTLVLLLAAYDRRVRSVVAFAPVPDAEAFVGPDLVDALERAMPGHLDFLEWSSPATHVSAVSVPIMLFHAKDDRVVPYADVAAYARALRAAGAGSELIAVETGGHCDFMVHSGIPRGIAWLKMTKTMKATKTKKRTRP